VERDLRFVAGEDEFAKGQTAEADQKAVPDAGETG
jgi:hypothetical protein